ncbi:hypothetical protein B0H19DRAFT_592708 [Mycena capillaripes]|nr:hypothetical protein B0H19DRAFT_592708 [Mycena capillaripes]
MLKSTRLSITQTPRALGACTAADTNQRQDERPISRGFQRLYRRTCRILWAISVAGHYGARRYYGGVDGLAGLAPDPPDRRQTKNILLMSLLPRRACFCATDGMSGNWSLHPKRYFADSRMRSTSRRQTKENARLPCDCTSACKALPSPSTRSEGLKECVSAFPLFLAVSSACIISFNFVRILHSSFRPELAGSHFI